MNWRKWRGRPAAKINKHIIPIEQKRIYTVKNKPEVILVKLSGRWGQKSKVLQTRDMCNTCNSMEKFWTTDKIFGRGPRERKRTQNCKNDTKADLNNLVKETTNDKDLIATLKSLEWKNSEMKMDDVCKFHNRTPNRFGKISGWQGNRTFWHEKMGPEHSTLTQESE